MNSNLLSSIFGHSPIGTIQEHITTAHQCVTELLPFFQMVLANDWEQAATFQQSICHLEQKADKLKKEIRLSLPRSLFLAVPRNELLDIVTKQDKVANRAKDIAGLVFGRQMSIPGPMQDVFMLYLQSAIATSKQALKAMNELDKVMAAGFNRHEMDVTEALIDELDDIESDTDKLKLENCQLLFSLEQKLPPVDVMFLYKIIDWVGDLSDRASRIGVYLQLLLAH